MNTDTCDCTYGETDFCEFCDMDIADCPCWHAEVDSK